MREPMYGELQSVLHKEAGAIWRTRNVEPEPCPSQGLMSDYVSDPEVDIEKDYATHVWGLLETISPREEKLINLRFVLDLTMEECGEVFGVTKERIRQIEKHALRLLRQPSRIGSLGIRPQRWSGYD